MKFFINSHEQYSMDNSLPLPIHRELPIGRRPWPPGQNRATRSANGFLFAHSEAVTRSYNGVLHSSGYRAMVSKPHMDTEIAALLTLLNRLPGVTTIESCGGYLTHGPNPAAFRSILPSITMIVVDPMSYGGLQMLASFLRSWTIKETYYQWFIHLNGCTWNDRFSIHELGSPSMAEDLNDADSASCPTYTPWPTILTHRQQIGEMARLDLNTITLALAFFEEYCGPDYYVTTWDPFLHGRLVTG